MTKEIISQDEMHEIHPSIPRAYRALKGGRVSRREFMRFATLLGMSAALATACSAPETGGGEEAATGGDETATGGEEAVVEQQAGGTLIVAMQTSQILDHPARLSWVEGAHIVRQVAEYLTETGPDNLTRPFLLEGWEANEDVTAWTLNLRQGIMFNNGEELTADDVIFNISQWLDDEVGSSVKGLMGYLEGDMGRVEKVDDYTVRLNLAFGDIGVPEHLFHYPAVILPRTFQGDFIAQPIGTGPYTLAEYDPDSGASFTRREDYWGGPDNQLPFLESIRFVNLDKDASLNAIQSGEIHTFYQPRATDWEALKDNPDITVRRARTAQALALRARVDTEPWNDPRVTKALRLCQDRQKILNLSWFGEGDLGADAHIAPVHPAYSPRDIPEKDIEGAKALLEEWAAETGNTLPIQATLVTKNDEGEAEIAQVLKEDAAEAGFELELDITEAAGYWERWTEVPLGITAWTHRPLGTMVLPLAYVADENGDPVAWNETRWVDEEFGQILQEASGTLDIEARRDLLGQLQDIFWERGPIGISFFKSRWMITRNEVKNLPAHPTDYMFFYQASLDQG